MTAFHQHKPFAETSHPFRWLASFYDMPYWAVINFPAGSFANSASMSNEPDTRRAYHFVRGRLTNQSTLHEFVTQCLDACNRCRPDMRFL